MMDPPQGALEVACRSALAWIELERQDGGECDKVKPAIASDGVLLSDNEGERGDEAR